MLREKEFDAILASVAEGVTVTKSCRDLGVSVGTFYAFLRKGDAELHERYRVAQETGAEALADSLTDIHETVENPMLARVVSENRRWLLSRRFAQRYGDRLTVSDDRTADLTAIIREAIARIPRPGSDLDKAIEHQTVTEQDIFGD